MKRLILFAIFLINVECDWREVIVNYKELKQQIPFLPKLTSFGKYELNNFDDNDNNDYSCDVVELRECALDRERYDSELDSDEESESDIEDYFERACKISTYTGECIGRARCSTASSLRASGLLSPRKAAVAALKLRIENILCNHPRYLDNQKCIAGVLTDYKDDFEECALNFENLIDTEYGRDKICKAASHYSECVQSLIRDHCGSTGAQVTCTITDAIIKELIGTDTCEIDCEMELYSLGKAIHIAAEKYSNIDDDNDEQYWDNTDDEDEAICEIATFKKCGHQFKEELNFKGRTVFEFLKELKELVDKKGKKGFEAICNAGRNFKECGDDKLNDCFNIDVLEEKIKLKEAEARALNVSVFMLRYECLHKEFDEDFDCMHSTAKKKQAVLLKCERRFREDLKKEGMPCKAGQTFIDCVSSPFKRSCGLKTGQAVCGLEMSILHEYGPHMRACPFHCDI